MEKARLRKWMIAKLMGFSENERKHIDQLLLTGLLETSLWKNANTIGITISGGFEWDTEPIIQAAWQTHKTVCVPKCMPREKKLTFRRITKFSELEKAHFNLMEPIPEKTETISKNNIDLLLVPGIVFDRQGYRIGFGGGYYDRFLTDFPNDTLSLIHSIQLIDHIPKESFDIPVGYILTEKKLLHTKEG